MSEEKNNTLTKADIVAALTVIYDRTLTKVKAAEILDTISEVVLKALEEGKTVDWYRMFKLKPELDEEGLVVGHQPGKGRLVGMTGALLVQMTSGQRFALGSGLSDALRRDPPPVGTWVTYRYRERTPSGLPRFASLVRVREVE